jgi:pilus assembly protein CpaF
VSLLKRIERGQAQEGDRSGDAAAGVDGQAQGEGRTLLDRNRPVYQAASQPAGVDVREQIQRRLMDTLGPDQIDVARTEELRGTIDELFTVILTEMGITMTRGERRRMYNEIVADILGYGPLEPLLEDEEIDEIMTVGHKSVYVEKHGLVEKTNVVFEDEDHLMRIIERIVAPLGRRIDESSPMVDARLPDGSRVNAVVRPVAIDGPALTIRKFAKKRLTLDDLVNLRTATPELLEFLRACVISGFNIIISGGTGSGKTTLLNVLSAFIPGNERIVTIENAAELRLRQEHVVRLESRPPNIEGKGEITIRDLVINSLRMRPDRIVVGEVRGGEALDLLQAMNTGHEGSLSTLHSNSPRDTIARLETMCLMAGMGLPSKAIREQIASAIDLIVHQDRMPDGSRKITKITEIQGMEGDVVTMADLFEFEQTGLGERGRIEGRFRATGLRPKGMQRILEAGIQLPPSIFGVGGRI